MPCQQQGYLHGENKVTFEKKTKHLNISVNKKIFYIKTVQSNKICLTVFGV